MNILITGGAGYIGSELVRQLAQRQDVTQIVIYDNLSSSNHNLFKFGKLPNKPIRFVHGDLLDTRKLRTCLKDVDIVYHLAAKIGSHFDNLDSHFFEQVNHWGTAELVYAVEESKVKKFIYLSSTAVYGGGRKIMDESTESNPRTYYGISKMRAEDHVKRLMTHKNALILRCGNVFGFSPSMKFSGVINKFMFDANFSNRIQINGNGTQSRPFISIQKLSQALSVLVEKEVPSDIYNLFDQNVKILDLVDILKEIYPPLEFIFINQHITMRDIKIAAPEKIAAWLPLPATTLRDELLLFRDSFSFRSQF